jgi:hypothetical protein
VLWMLAIGGGLRVPDLAGISDMQGMPEQADV